MRKMFFYLACSGLGGAYDVAYDYDSQYRLIEAQSGSGNFPYHFLANYSLAGRLGHSFCSNTTVADIDASYGYDNHRWTHQPRVVYDGVTKYLLFLPGFHRLVTRLR